MFSSPERSTVDGPQLDDSAKAVRPSARTRVDSVIGLCTPMETRTNSIMDSPKETRVDSVMGSPAETRVNSIMGSPKETRVDSVMGSPAETRVNSAVGSPNATKVDNVAAGRSPKKTRFDSVTAVNSPVGTRADSVTTGRSSKAPQTRTITVPITVTIPADAYYQDCKVKVTGETQISVVSPSTGIFSAVANSSSPFQVECFSYSPHKSQPQETPSDTSPLTRALNDRITDLRLDEPTAKDQTNSASDSGSEIVSAMKKLRGDGRVPETRARGGMMTDEMADEMASKYFDFPRYIGPSTRKHTKIYVEGSLL